MKFKVDLTIEAYIEIEADSEEEARANVEDGYSLSNIYLVSDEIDDVSLMSI